jgi:hypothetical protein
MKISSLVLTFTLAAGLFSAVTNLFAHGPGSGEFSDDIIVTRHFTGTWDQVDQESQGLSLDVIEQDDDSRRSVMYWFTYGNDRKTAWYLGIGDLVENRIEFALYDSTDVGFMQDAMPDDESVHNIGTMTVTFDSCTTGSVVFDTSHAEVGSGSFNIERLTDVMNTHCSGGISDDMHSDTTYGEQRIDLMPARDGITGSGHARYEDYSGHMEFEVDVEGMPDGVYHLYTGMQYRGEFSVSEGRGEMEFVSPGETGKMMLNFDPRGMQIEIHDAQGVVLSSQDGTFENYEHGHDGQGSEDHHHDCEMGHGPGHGMGGGMVDCVNDGEYVELQVDLQNSGVLDGAKGEAEWDMNTHRVEFSVEIEDVSAGVYMLKVGGEDVGLIEAFEMHGEVYGHIQFRDPESRGKQQLDFDPRGQKIEVFQGTDVILEADFPEE